MGIFQIVVFVLFVLAVFTLFRKGVISAADPFSHAYVGYYAASRLFIDEGWSPEVYNNTWFITYSLSLTDGKVGEVIGPNLPTMAIITLPAAFFPLTLGRIFWAIENVIFAILGVTFLSASIRPKRTWWFYGLVVVVSFFFPPLIRNLELGQAYLVVFFMLAVVVYGIHLEKDWLAGLGLAFAFILKSAGVFLWLIPLINQKWRVLAWGAGLAIFLAFITLPRIGLDTWAAYPQALLNTNSDPSLTATAYQSISGLLNHLFRYHEIWSPAPLIEAPALAQTLTFITTLLTLGYTLWKIRHASINLQMAALLILNTLLVPLVEEHQLVLILIPIILLSADLFTSPFDWQIERSTVLWLLVGVCLLIFPIPYKNPVISAGWLSFLAYPRLYGNILLWLLTLKRINRK